MAAKAEVTVSYLGEIETGRQPGSLAAMLRLARALGVTAEDLVPLSAG